MRRDCTPRVLFVSVDPNRDTPERIAAYLNGFDPEFAGVTASDAELAPLLTALGVAVEKHEHGGANYNVVHNSADLRARSERRVDRGLDGPARSEGRSPPTICAFGSGTHGPRPPGA